jgi:endonuclease/exonuclease/phosphatase family metal-dependent hydrolase
MTANLLNDRADAGQLADILDRVQPDVLVAQELGPAAASVIAERFPHHRLEPGLDKRGRGIATRLPSRFGGLELPGRGGSWARVELGSFVMSVAGVHMVNPIDFPWWVSARLRSMQVNALVSWDSEAGEAVCVVAGDMNASPIWPVYRKLTSRWKDLVHEAGLASGRPPRRTWGWRPGWPRLLRVDHVMGRGLVGLSSWVEPVRGSDHAAVVVDAAPSP